MSGREETKISRESENYLNSPEVNEDYGRIYGWLTSVNVNLFPPASVEKKGGSKWIIVSFFNHLSEEMLYKPYKFAEDERLFFYLKFGENWKSALHSIVKGN